MLQAVAPRELKTISQNVSSCERQYNHSHAAYPGLYDRRTGERTQLVSELVSVERRGKSISILIQSY
jgi:hypothetical protein